MTSEGLGEMFEGDSVDTCTGKFPLVSMGGRADRQVCADGERGPPSARAEVLNQLSKTKNHVLYKSFCIILMQNVVPQNKKAPFEDIYLSIELLRGY